MDRETFLARVRDSGDEVDAAVVQRLYEWADARDLKDSWAAAGSVHGEEYAPVMKRIEWEPVVFSVSSSPPRLWMAGENLRHHHPFSIDKEWNAAVDRFCAMPGAVRTKLEVYPHILLPHLAEESTWSQVVEHVEWVMGRIRRSEELGLK